MKTLEDLFLESVQNRKGGDMSRHDIGEKNE